MSIIVNTFSKGIRPIVPQVSEVACTLVKKLIELVKNFSNITQWSFLCLYGTKEILFDRVKDLRKTNKDIVLSQASRINLFLNKIFLKRDPCIGPFRYHQVHGALYLGAGISGMAAAMHKLEWIHIGDLTIPVALAAQGVFCFASLIALIQNVKIYCEASKVSAYAPLHEIEGAAMLKKSAILGIISTLNYIIGASLIMIGAAATFSLFFGCIAVMTGCLKILYDFFRFNKAR